MAAEKVSSEMWNIPLDVLQQYTCSKCYKYLTVLPVTKNVELKTLICGRESCKKFITDNDKIDTITNHLFENNATFRCINHYSGCSVLMNSSNAEDHENWCIHGEKKECPFCLTFTGNWVQILSHLKENHSDRIFEEHQFYSFSFLPECTLIYPDKDGNISLIELVTTTEKDILIKVSWCNSKSKTRSQVEKTFNNSVIFAKDPDDSTKFHTKEFTTNLLITRKELLKHFKEIDDSIHCQFEINLINNNKEPEDKQALMNTYEKKINQLLEAFAKLSMPSNSYINNYFAAFKMRSPHKCPVNGCFKILSSSKLFIEHWHHNNAKLVYNRKCFTVGRNKRNARIFWLIENDLYKVETVMEEEKNLLTISIDEINALKSRNFLVGLSFEKERGPFTKYDIPAVQNLPGKWMFSDGICKSPQFNVYYE